MKTFYSTINLCAYKKHILTMEARSCGIWRMDLCKQAKEQSRVVLIFQILHFQYSTKLVLKGVLQCPVMYTGFQRCLHALKLYNRIYDHFLSLHKFCFLNIALFHCGFIYSFCWNLVFLGKDSLLSIINAMLAHFPHVDIKCIRITP